MDVSLVSVPHFFYYPGRGGKKRETQNLTRQKIPALSELTLKIFSDRNSNLYIPGFS